MILGSFETYSSAAVVLARNGNNAGNSFQDFTCWKSRNQSLRVIFIHNCYFILERNSTESAGSCIGAADMNLTGACYYFAIHWITQQLPFSEAPACLPFAHTGWCQLCISLCVSDDTERVYVSAYVLLRVQYKVVRVQVVCFSSIVHSCIQHLENHVFCRHSIWLQQTVL